MDATRAPLYSFLYPIFTDVIVSDPPTALSLKKNTGSCSVRSLVKFLNADNDVIPIAPLTND